MTPSATEQAAKAIQWVSQARYGGDVPRSFLICKSQVAASSQSAASAQAVLEAEVTDLRQKVKLLTQQKAEDEVSSLRLAGS